MNLSITIILSSHQYISPLNYAGLEFKRAKLLTIPAQNALKKKRQFHPKIPLLVMNDVKSNAAKIDLLNFRHRNLDPEPIPPLLEVP